MPIYQYECPECGAVFEALQKNARSKAPDCVSCGRRGARRRVTAARTHLGGRRSCEQADVCRPAEPCAELARSGQCACPHAQD